MSNVPYPYPTMSSDYITHTVQFHSNAPINPIDGDMYYDSVVGNFFTYFNGKWEKLKLHRSVNFSSFERVRKIKMLIDIIG